jgi:hypothetical protein
VILRFNNFNHLQDRLRAGFWAAEALWSRKISQESELLREWINVYTMRHPHSRIQRVYSNNMRVFREKPVNFGRHTRSCSVCVHPQRAEIEAEFVSWGSPSAIAKQYQLGDRASVYRHAHAAGLFAKRQRNIRAALERIIEKAGEVEVTSSAVVAAIQAYAKINSVGHWIEPSEQLSLRDAFDRLTRDELEAYASDGSLPAWFPRTPATGGIRGDHA